LEEVIDSRAGAGKTQDDEPRAISWGQKVRKGWGHVKGHQTNLGESFQWPTLEQFDQRE